MNDKGIPRKIEGMYAKIYGVKEVAGVYGDGMRVGLHKVGRKRLKSAKNEVEITPFAKGIYKYFIIILILPLYDFLYFFFVLFLLIFIIFSFK